MFYFYTYKVSIVDIDKGFLDCFVRNSKTLFAKSADVTV